jgi:hypothetical protein
MEWAKDTATPAVEFQPATAGCSSRLKEATSPSAAHLHGALFNAGRVAVDAGCWVHRHCSAAQVELPAVPRAGHDAALQLTLAQRATAMKAGVVDGKKFSINVKQSDAFFRQAKGFAAASRNVVDLRGEHKLGHTNLLSDFRTENTPSPNKRQRLAKSSDSAGTFAEVYFERFLRLLRLRLSSTPTAFNLGLNGFSFRTLSLILSTGWRSKMMPQICSATCSSKVNEL